MATIGTKDNDSWTIGKTVTFTLPGLAHAAPATVVLTKPVRGRGRPRKVQPGRLG